MSNQRTEGVSTWRLSAHPDGRLAGAEATYYPTLEDAIREACLAERAFPTIEGFHYGLMWSLSCLGGSDEHWQGWHTQDLEAAEIGEERFPIWVVTKV